MDSSRGPKRELGSPRRPSDGGSRVRYVIVIMSITLFLLWDLLYNGGNAIGSTVLEVHRVARLVTG